MKNRMGFLSIISQTGIPVKRVTKLDMVKDAISMIKDHGFKRN
ncbi:MAG: hypothetical protein ACI33J_00310 [Clostridium sp.]